MISSILAGISAGIWTYLLLGRGSFWHVHKHLLPPMARSEPASAKIVAVVPARNEADVIERSISSLVREALVQHIVLVDDGSTDGTAGVAASVGSTKLTVLSAASKPPRWTGKLWALSHGVQQAERFAPDFFLLTDADIEHAPGEIAALVHHAVSHNLDLVSYMVRLHCKTFAEQALIPAFVFFFLKLYPPEWTSSPARKTAGSAGGCVLLRPAMLSRIGGFETISTEIIDDCALASAVKLHGGRVWMGLARETRSIRPYGGFAGIGSMISRTAFNQLRHSSILLIATLAGLCVTYLVPPLLLFNRNRGPKLLGAAAYGMMAISYLPTVRFYRRSPLWALGLPAIAFFYAGATVHSAFRFWSGQGGAWKARLQDVHRRP